MSGSAPQTAPPHEPALQHQSTQPRIQPHNNPRPAPLPDRIKHLTFNAPPAPPASDCYHCPNLGPDQAEDNPSDGYGDEGGLDYLTLSPVVLAVTVDGHVHGLQRNTGQWLWTLHDDGGIAGGKGRTTAGTDSSILNSTRPLTPPLVRSRARKTTPAPPTKVSNHTAISAPDVIDEEVYVIEPAGQGAIYLYTRSDGVLEKLPLTMQELVNMEAFTFPTDDSRVFVGKKESKLVGVDLRTGRLVGVFGNGDGWCEWDQDSEVNGGRVRTDECDEQISRRPEDLLYMAKTGKRLVKPLAIAAVAPID